MPVADDVRRSGRTTSGVKQGLGAMTEAVSDRQPAPLTTRIAIQAAALDLFSRIGYPAASMREIARSVGIQPASLYNHYSSKEDILWAICREAMDELLHHVAEVLTDDAAPSEQLARFVSEHVRFHIDSRDAALVINRQLASLTPEHYAEITDMRDRYEHRLRGLLRRGVNEGVFRVPDTRLASYAILAMGLHVSVWYRPDGPLSPDDIIATQVRLALQLVGAVPGAEPLPAASS